jgi:hypothetical protein
MSFVECIAGKSLSATQIQKLSDSYTELSTQYSKGMSDTDAAALAAQNIVAMEAKRLSDEKRATMKQANQQALLRVKVDEAHKASTSAYEKLNGAAKFFTPKPSRAAVVGEMYERAFIRGETLFAEFSMQLENSIDAMKAKNLGFSQDHEMAKNVVRAVIDGDMDGDIGKLAQEIRSTFEQVNKAHNQAGGIIGKLDNYYPQVHDGARIGQVDFKTWWNETKDLLDRERMVDPDTGLPFTDARLAEMAEFSYKDITTNGMHSINEAYAKGKTIVGGGGDIAGRKKARRFFHFKGGDAFLKYNAAYGSGDTGLWDAVVGHVQGMSRDIGMMQVLGPKSGSTSKMFDTYMGGEQFDQKRKLTNGMYTVLSGAGGSQGYEHPLYRGVAGMQNIMRSSMLGGASISAISDAIFTKMAADKSGLGATRSAMVDYFKSATNDAERKLVANSWQIAEMASNSGASASRAFDGTGTQRQGKTAFLASFTNRASGLQAMTIAAGDALSLSLASDVAHYVNTKTGWADLPADFKRSATRYGVTENDWKVISKVTPLKTEKGASFTTPEEVAKFNVETARRLSDWDASLRYLATNSPTLKMRALSTGAALGDGSYGSAMRAISSSFFMFKSFPINMMFNYLMPALAQAAQGKVAPLMTMAVGGTVFGAVALQAKQMVMGKDPRDMEDGKFWAAAAAQGGGMGLFGDYLFKDQGRFGRGFLTDMLGPMFGFGNDVSRLFMGNFQGALTEDDFSTSKLWGDMTKFTQRYTPAASLWYARLALERGLFDTINKMVNADFDNQAARVARKYEKEYGQKQFWKAGELLPQRAPDLSKAVGGSAPSF